MRKSFLKTVVATAVVGTVMAFTGISAWAAAMDFSGDKNPTTVTFTSITTNSKSYSGTDYNNVTWSGLQSDLKSGRTADIRANADESAAGKIIFEIPASTNVKVTVNLGSNGKAFLLKTDDGSITPMVGNMVNGSSSTSYTSGTTGGTVLVTAGNYTIYGTDTGSNTKVASINFEKLNEVLTATKFEWDFSSAETGYSDVNYQSTSVRGIVKANSNSSNVSLYADPMSAESSGKFAFNTSKNAIQMNAGSNAYIPVYSAGDVVYITTTENGAATLSGNSPTVTSVKTTPVAYTADGVDAGNGYVLLTVPSGKTAYITIITLYTSNAPFYSSNVKYYYADSKCYAVSVIPAAQAALADRVEQAYGKRFASTKTVYKKVKIGGTEYDATYAAFGGEEGDYLYATIITNPGSSAQTNIEKITTNLF